jgi:hypothetical protein
MPRLEEKTALVPPAEESRERIIIGAFAGRKMRPAVISYGTGTLQNQLCPPVTVDALVLPESDAPSRGENSSTTGLSCRREVFPAEERSLLQKRVENG